MRFLPLFFTFTAAAVAAGCGPARTDGRSDGDVAEEPHDERPPRRLATIENEGTVAIAADAAHVYATTRGDTRGSVVRVPIEGGRYEVLASVDPAPFAIAVDDEHAYFTVRETGRVHRVKKSGGPVEIVAEPHARSNGAEAIALEGSHVYWTAVGGVFRAPKSPVSPVSRVSREAERIAEDDEGAAALAVDGGEVFWIARGTANDPMGALYKVQATGGAKTALGTGPIFMPTWGFSIAVSGSFVFVPDTAGGRVYRVHRSTGALGLVSEGEDSPTAIAADGQRVYWSTGGTTLARSETRTLSSAAIESAGGPPERLVVTRQANVFAIASNGTDVFFTDYVTTGSIYRAR